MALGAHDGGLRQRRASPPRPRRRTRRPSRSASALEPLRVRAASRPTRRRPPRTRSRSASSPRPPTRSRAVYPPASSGGSGSSTVVASRRARPLDVHRRLLACRCASRRAPPSAPAPPSGAAGSRRARTVDGSPAVHPPATSTCAGSNRGSRISHPSSPSHSAPCPRPAVRAPSARELELPRPVDAHRDRPPVALPRPTASTGIFAPLLVVRVGCDQSATPPGRTSPSTFAPGICGQLSPTTSRSGASSGAARPSGVHSRHERRRVGARRARGAVELHRQHRRERRPRVAARHERVLPAHHHQPAAAAHVALRCSAGTSRGRTAARRSPAARWRRSSAGAR